MVESIEEREFDITEEKLQRKDYYRYQVQPETTDDKLFYAVIYGIIEKMYPEAAKDIRNHLAKEINKEVRSRCRTIWKSNATIKAMLPRYVDEKVKPSLRKKVNDIVNEMNKD